MHTSYTQLHTVPVQCHAVEYALGTLPLAGCTSLSSIIAICRLMGWSEERKQHNYKPGSFADVYDGTRWQSAVVGDANIAPDGQLGRNVVIGICGDGVNPFKHKNYSMWPLAVACFNLPGHLRITLPAMGLLFVIPPHGPKRGEPNDFQPFLDIIADQLRHAYWYGIEGCVDGSWRQVQTSCDMPCMHIHTCTLTA